MTNHPNRSQRRPITVPNVSLRLLRQQRETLAQLAGELDRTRALEFVERKAALAGVIQLIDSMLDIAEGYEPW